MKDEVRAGSQKPESRIQKMSGKRQNITRRHKGTEGSGVVRGLNLFLQGWGNYFRKGHSSKAFGKLNAYVNNRMYNFLQRRSQRGYKKKTVEGSWYRELRDLGVMQLKKEQYG